MHHFSALWVDLEPLVNAGLVAMSFTAYMPAVAPAAFAEIKVAEKPSQDAMLAAIGRA